MIAYSQYNRRDRVLTTRARDEGRGLVIVVRKVHVCLDLAAVRIGSRSKSRVTVSRWRRGRAWDDVPAYGRHPKQRPPPHSISSTTWIPNRPFRVRSSSASSC